MSRTREAIVMEARRWLGTPYRHQQSQLGVGCDCLGLVRGVWRACIGPEPEAIPAYTPDWAATGAEQLQQAFARWMVPAAHALTGDVLLFRMHPEAPARHAAVLTGDERMLHAYWGRAVLESRLSPYWRTRMAGVFSFPGVC